MPIIDIQRRLHEVGRIRLGEQVPNKNGNGTHPAKLDKFRFTSSDEYSINLVAKVYGGTVQPWDGASVGTQWELYTESTNLDVIVPPVELAFDQWLENWSGGICRNRCDGQTDVKNDCACSCDPDNQVCKPTTRIGVILTAVDGIGTWRLETHGWAAAAELNGSIEVLKAVQNRGAMVPARLLLKQRQQKRINADTGKPETFNFAVPVLDLNLSVAALTGALSDTPRLESGVIPIAAHSEELPSIAEQAKAVETPIERPKRSNAAATLPATGIAPRPAAAVTEPPKPDAAPSTPGEPLVTEPQGRNIGRLFGKLKITDRAERLEFLADHFNHPFDSSKELTKREGSELISYLMSLAGEEEKPRESSSRSSSKSEPYDDPNDPEAPF